MFLMVLGRKTASGSGPAHLLMLHSIAGTFPASPCLLTVQR